jgi:hypothetical protein
MEYIERAILVLQGRLVTLMDLPTAAPYLFVPPAWDDAEARAMLDGISITEYQNVINGTVARLRSTSPWDVQTIINALHAENGAAGVKPARFMTVLRHAMSGVKVRALGYLIFGANLTARGRMGRASQKSWISWALKGLSRAWKRQTICAMHGFLASLTTEKYSDLHCPFR